MAAHRLQKRRVHPLLHPHRPTQVSVAATAPYTPAPQPRINPRLPNRGPISARQVHARPAARPKPLTDQQLAQRIVDQTVAPLSAALERRAQQGQSAITGYTQALAGELHGYAPAAAQLYQGAEQQAQSQNDALAAYLKSVGASSGAALQQTLSAAGQDTRPAAAAAQVGGGSAAASLGKGSAELGALLAQGTAAQDYGLKLPGIAALSGLQGTRQLQAQKSSELSDLVGQVQSRYPDILSQVQSNRLEAAKNALAQRIAAKEFGLKAQNQQFQQAATEARVAQGAARVRLSARQADRSYAIQLRKLGIAEQKAARDAAKAHSGFAGLSPTQQQKVKEDAQKRAELYYYGQAPKKHYDAASGRFLNVPGTGVPGVDYKSALRRMLAAGIPLRVATRALNTYYAPGEDGRPNPKVRRARRAAHHVGASVG